MEVQFFNFAKLLEGSRTELVNSLEECLEHGKFILGPEVEEFEERFAQKSNSDYCIGVSNGTDALSAILMSLDLPKGCDVLVPAFTFISSASVILKAGFNPVFVDLEEGEFKISTRTVAEKCTSNTRALIYVHLFGEHSDLTEMLPFLEEKGILLIEDCAQSYGAPNGNYGIASSYSFFPAKNLGCLGDGGAVTTNDKALAEKIKMVRTHGTSAPYQYEMMGGNYRLDTLQASFLNKLILRADEWIEKRRSNAKFYISELTGIGDLVLPKFTEEHAFNQFTLRTEHRDDLKSFLNSNGVSANIYYPAPLYSNEIFGPTDLLPETEKTCQEVLSIPIYSELTEDELQYVVDTIKGYYE